MKLRMNFIDDKKNICIQFYSFILKYFVKIVLPFLCYCYIEKDRNYMTRLRSKFCTEFQMK